MPPAKQGFENQADKKKRTKPEPPSTTPDLTGEITAALPIPSFIQASNGEDSGSQATRLTDPQLLLGQRQSMAIKIGQLKGNRYLQRVLAQQKGEKVVDDDELEDQLGGTPEAAIQRQPAGPAPAPPSVSVTPLAISVGTHQKFPLRYRLQNFTETDQVTGSATIHNAPVSLTEDIRLPTSANETGNMLLEADASEGQGTLTTSLDYKGQTIESAPVTITVTPGTAASSSPDRIFFDTDSDAIRSDAAPALAQLAARLRAEPNLIVKLEGHADTRFTDEYNARLSVRRAQSARNYLINVLGIDAARVPEEHVTGRGEAAPAVTPEVNPADFQANRRVEIILAESASGKELAPTVTLSPQKVVTGPGESFSIAYEMRNTHETSQFGGAALITTGDLSLASGELPRLPGQDTGVLTMQAGATVGLTNMTISINYGGAEYKSNKVDVEVVAPPSADYIVPFDRNPLSVPGEMILFNERLSHANSAEFQLVYTSLGGAFDTSTGPAEKTIPGLVSGNLPFYISSTWDGSTTVMVQLQVQRISDKTVFHNFTWNFGLKPYLPTDMTQQEGEGEVALPSSYSYKIGPDRSADGRDDYLHQTILETFGQRTCNIALNELKPAFRTAHPDITTPADITAHFFGTRSNNGTFTVSAGDMIYDQHNGGMPDLVVFTRALITMKEVYVDLPQTYEATPGVALGRYTIRRIIKPDGTKALRKMRR